MRICPLLFILMCAFSLTACMGGSDTDTLDPAPASSASQAPQAAQAQQAQIEIAVGMPATKVSQLLGAADSIDKDSKGREVWFYERKRAQFVYASNARNVQALVIGGYSGGGDGPANSLPLNLRITFDGSRKVIDFAFNQMGF